MQDHIYHIKTIREIKIYVSDVLLLSNYLMNEPERYILWDLRDYQY